MHFPIWPLNVMTRQLGTEEILPDVRGGNGKGLEGLSHMRIAALEVQRDPFCAGADAAPHPDPR